MGPDLHKDGHKRKYYAQSLKMFTVRKQDTLRNMCQGFLTSMAIAIGKSVPSNKPTTSSIFKFSSLSDL